MLNSLGINKNTKRKNKNKNIVVVIIAAVILAITVFYIVKFPIKSNQILVNEKNHLMFSEDSYSWENYQNLNQINPASEYSVFSSLSDAERQSLNSNFVKKILDCLKVKIDVEIENQLIQNLSQGASREAVLRGLISKQEVTDLIESKTSSLPNNELRSYISNFSAQFLQRDDFEIPLDMRNYELKIALMEEFLDVSEEHLLHDSRKLYLWAAAILNLTEGKFDLTQNRNQLLAVVSKIPTDHLKAEVPLSICQKIDSFTKN